MRLKKLWITIILICCSLLLFVACGEERVAESIALNGYSAETPLEVRIGKFSYSNYTVSVTYEDGETEELPLSEEMISETDKLKFYKDGENEVTISYKGAETVVAINVLRNEFSKNVQLKDFTATYTGEDFTIEVEGDIPGGTKILYPQGNTFQNAGTYDVSAILQCDGYVTETLYAKVVINKATYDVSNAQLYDDKVVYDKNTHNLAVKGKAVEEEDGSILHNVAQLPKGVSVSYTITKIKNGMGEAIAGNNQQVIDGNKATDAGTYRVCAQFRGDYGNYNAIPDSIAYLTIERASYDTSKIEFIDETVTYSGNAHSLSIATNTKLPSDVEIFYQIKRLKDGAGVAVSDTYKDGNSAIDAGVYMVKATFKVVGKNADNYTTSPLAKEAYLNILRASYDEVMEDVYLDSQWDKFEAGKTYEIYFEADLPQGVTPQFTLTNEDGETIVGKMEIVTSEEDDGQTEDKTTYKYSFTVETAGEYTCVITFKHNNKNYEGITKELKAWIFIDNEV